MSADEQWAYVSAGFLTGLDWYAESDDFGGLAAYMRTLVADLVRRIADHGDCACADCETARRASDFAHHVHDTECGDHIIAADEFDQTSDGAAFRELVAFEFDLDSDDDSDA